MINNIDEKDQKQTPVMIYRAVLSSYERFICLLLEQFKGVLPLWISPVIVIGNKEIEENSVSFRKLGSKVQNSMNLDEFVKMIKMEDNGLE